MEDLHCSKFFQPDNKSFCRIDLKDDYFSVPPRNRKNWPDLMVRKSLQISVPIFRSKTCSKSLNKAIERNNCNTAQDKHMLYHLFG